jgi:hypothetical protein
MVSELGFLFLPEAIALTVLTCSLVCRETKARFLSDSNTRIRVRIGLFVIVVFHIGGLNGLLTLIGTPANVKLSRERNAQ